MSVTFPIAVPNYPDTSGSEVLGAAAGGLGLSRILDDYGLDIAAIATKIGTGADTPAANQFLRSPGDGVSEWSPVVLATDITGFGPSVIPWLADATAPKLRAALLAAAAGAATGNAGAVVFSASPVINTPTLNSPAIASFIQAQHNHSGGSFGGPIVPAALAAASWLPIDWTPTWTGLTVGNGVGVYKYSRVGNLVFFYIRFTLGSTSAMGTGPYFTLPITPLADQYNSASAEGVPIGRMAMLDAATARWIGHLNFRASSPEIYLALEGAAGTFVTQGGGLTSAAPFTWGTGDSFSANGWYFAA